jgi:uncharacterized Zn finger protein
MNPDEWIMCPSCGHTDVIVERDIGDRGGTESFTINCLDCYDVVTVTP